MANREAKARIRINELLQRSGWRFFDNDNGPANLALEPNVKLKQKALDALGNDFEKTANGFIDYLLLDDRGFPVAVLEAKRESLDPLVGKEKARQYARSQNVRFAILSNGKPTGFAGLTGVAAEPHFSGVAKAADGGSVADPLVFPWYRPASAGRAACAG